MGNAKNIGRIGALAVALGIGTAVTTPWVAVAEPSADSSPASATESTSTDDSKPATSVDTSDGAPTAADTGVADGDPRSGIVQSSGGAHTSSSSAVAGADDDDMSATPQTPEPTVGEPADAGPTTDPEASTPEQPAVSEPPVSPPVTEPVAPTEPSGSDGPAPAQPVTIDLPQADALAAATDTADPTDAGLHAPGGYYPRKLGAHPPEGQGDSTTTASAAPATAIAAQLVPATQAAPASPVAVVSGLVSGLLAWVGLGPSLTNAPVAPVEAPGLWGLLAWVRREIERTLFNQTPTTAYNPAENSQAVDGVVTGDLHAVDDDGDPLVFTITQAPQNGSVVVNPDGTFVYTPSAQLAATGGTDQFTVNVEDQGFHLHGLPGLLNLVTFGLLGDSGHNTTATVTLTVQPINQPPQVGNPAFTIDAVDPETGVVTGTVNVTDPDGDSLVYSLSGVPNHGTFSVNTTGEWTYTPSLDARLRATDVNAIPADQQVSFSIVASDGLATAVVPIVAPVTPLATTTIAVGDFPIDVAVSPDGTTAYVVNFGDNSVSVIDTETNVVTTIAVGTVPSGVAVSPDGATVYVTTIGGDSVSVIDTTTNAVTTIAVGDGPSGVAVSPDGATVYVINASGDSVSVIDTTTNVVTTIAVGDQPFGVAVTPDGGTVYVANAESDTVSVIDTATNAVTTIAVGNRPFHVAISPDGATVYVSNGIAGTVSVIDTATNTVTTTINGVTGGLVVSPDGAHVYVTNQFGDSVSVIDTATNTVTATIAVGDDPRAVAISPDGTHLYVTNASDDSVTVITLG